MQVRQRFGLRLVTIIGFFGTAVIIFFVSVINLTTTEKIKATGIEISTVKEQVFVNDKSIDAPIINIQQKTSPNTILIQPIKEIPASTSPNE